MTVQTEYEELNKIEEPHIESDENSEEMQDEQHDASDEAGDETEFEESEDESEDSEENNEVPESEEETEDSEVSNRKDNVQKRIDRLVAKAKKAEEELERYRQKEWELQQYQQAQDIPRPPNFNDYDNWKDYVQAEYAYKEQIAQRQQVLEQQKQQAQIHNYQQNLQNEYQQRVEKAYVKYSDYEDCEDFVGGELSRIGNGTALAVATAIKASDIGPDLVYFLAKNKQKFSEITQLDPTKALLKLGALEANFAQNRKVKSNAPKPIRKSKGVSSNAKNLTYEDYVKICK